MINYRYSEHSLQLLIKQNLINFIFIIFNLYNVNKYDINLLKKFDFNFNYIRWDIIIILKNIINKKIHFQIIEKKWFTSNTDNMCFHLITVVYAMSLKVEVAQAKARATSFVWLSILIITCLFLSHMPALNSLLLCN